MPKLTLYQFNALDTEQRIKTLENHGIYLEVYRYAAGCKVALFSLYGFYAEVWLQEKKDKIVRINAFSSYNKLDAYLKDIDLTPIYAML